MQCAGALSARQNLRSGSPCHTHAGSVTVYCTTTGSPAAPTIRGSTCMVSGEAPWTIACGHRGSNGGELFAIRASARSPRFARNASVKCRSLSLLRQRSGRSQTCRLGQPSPAEWKASPDVRAVLGEVFHSGGRLPRPDQIRRSANTAFSPPKAKAFDNTTSTSTSRATFGTTSSAHSGSASS